MKFIVKYSIGFYLIITLLFKLAFVLSHSFVNSLFYILMAIGVLILPFYSKVIYSRQSIKTFWVFHLVNLLNFIYLLLFDLNNIPSIFYFLTKLSGFNLIILGLIYNYSFYRNWIVKYFKYLMVVMLLLGMLFVGGSTQSTRLAIGYNPNDVGLFGLLGLFAIITFNPKWQKDKIDLALVIFFFVIALLSGSKATLLGICVVAFLNYGISLKSIGLASLCLVTIFVVSSLGYSTGVDRLMSKEGTFETRDVAYKNGMLTFMDEFTFGNGLDKYGWSNPKYFESPELAFGAHNTYISIGIMYGVLFGSIFIFLLLLFLSSIRAKVLKKGDEFVLFSYYFMLLIMIIGFFETLIVGVNETVTLLFWFSLGVVAYEYSSKSKVKYVTGN
jgi:hypothetical protein